MENPLRWSALVALDSPHLPEPDELADALQQEFPDAPPFRPAGRTEALLTGQIGDYTFAVTLVPQPIPWSQLEGPCATAWYWPEAASDLRGHQAHLLLTLVDE